MAPDELLRKIKSAPSARQFVEQELLQPIPWIFEGDEEGYELWRGDVARKAEVDQKGIFIVGSAATGYSLSPAKPGRLFRAVGLGGDPPSDIDIAIIDENLFFLTWNLIVSLDRGRALSRRLSHVWTKRRGTFVGQVKHMRESVYWGTIGHAFVPRGTDIAQRIRMLFAATTRRTPFLGHEAHARIYRRREDLVGYHEWGIGELLDELERRIGGAQ